ncbi:hypothetical protein PV05_03382 [Exophiala xenobiotica]|uniref:Uncharacterized protein n=1 Tax=Exophiala xenobiotica TaxID=348802 RepID=A0A0D2FFK1_9EURO|nr:uncharacterized protein PV05_03382 [Exophiala xenobiotica]KIW58889.1 hypothetical protein PV05_03382 [Exophiala xenobiotica]
MLAVFNKAQSTLDNKAEPILACHDPYEQELEVVKLTCKISKTLYKKDGGFNVLPHGLKPIPTGLSFEQYGGLSMNSQKRRESAAKCWHTASSTLRAPFSISMADMSKRPCVVPPKIPQLPYRDTRTMCGTGKGELPPRDGGISPHSQSESGRVSSVRGYDQGLA